jgi:triosephosphate isomerase
MPGSLLDRRIAEGPGPIMTETKTPRPLVAGNWKMNGLKASASEITALGEKLAGAKAPGCEILVCPPATLLSTFAPLAVKAGIGLGAQDCHAKPSGAHTGDISAEMLADIGCAYVIVGHSERRADHAESDEIVKAKAEAAHRAGLAAIICVGETEVERDAGDTLEVVAGQIADSIPKDATAANTVIAYEPVWAIGTGRTPSTDDVAEVHGLIRNALDMRVGEEGKAMRILYGGSVKPANARQLMAVPNVDGALVGGASLKAEDFWGIIEAYA